MFVEKNYIQVEKMKKVGILSMQKVMNYGSFLQAFALKTTIEQLGHKCEFIDIEQGKIFPELKRSMSFLINKAIERYFKYDVLTRIRYTKLFQYRFTQEFFGLLGTDVHTISHFDTVVIGSDEVFNFAQRVPWGYTTQLYGNIKNADRVISYAGSFGHTSMEDIQRFGVTDEISNALKSMDAVSVRDDNSYDIIKALIGIKPAKHIDPVLMFDYDKYAVPCSERDYIVIYTYPNRIKEKREIDAIRSFAHKHNKKIISIGFYFPWADKTVIPTPFEVLGYIKCADYIITDTFHGTVMSIKMNRPFATLIRSSNKQKLTSLLSQFNIADRSVGCMSQLEATLLRHIDYEKVNAMLAQEKNKSIKYLEDNI